MGFANMQDYIVINKKTGSASLDFSKLTPNQAAAIQELTTEEFVERTTGKPRTVRRTRFKLADKRGALELLGKHKKLFTDKVENTLQNPDGTAIAPPVLNVNFVEAEDGQPKKKRTK
jgi:phage terminase small subunit